MCVWQSQGKGWNAGGWAWMVGGASAECESRPIREGVASEFENIARNLPFGFKKLRERPILGFETLREMSLALGVSQVGEPSYLPPPYFGLEHVNIGMWRRVRRGICFLRNIFFIFLLDVLS